MKDQIEGSFDEAIGSAKSAIGEQIGDEKLKDEGLVQQADGNIKKVAGEVKDRLADAVDHVKDAFKNH